MADNNIVEKRLASLVKIEDVAARLLQSWWFFGLVSVAIVLLLALASVPWWFNRFVLEARTRVVEISASASAVHPIGLTLPNGAEIQVLSAPKDDLPPEFTALAAPTVSVRLVSSNTTLQSITLPTGARLLISARPDGRTDVGVLNGGNIGLVLSGTVERIDEDGHHTSVANLKRAIAWDITAANGQAPVRLVLPASAGQLALYNQPIGELRLARPRSSDDNTLTFQSEILAGSRIKLLDTNTTVDLQPRELVLLDGGRWFLSRLEVTDKAIALDIVGEANKISVGPPRAGGPFKLDRDLTPSVLSYLVGQYQLKLIWGGALAILATLWKARQWAVKWGK